MKKILSLVLILVVVTPAFAARKLSEPKDDFSSMKAYNTQVTRAEKDPKQAYVLVCACQNGKAYGSDYDDKWLTMASDGGVADAQYKLAVGYQERGKVKDAVALYKKAADQGLVEAQCKLATWYRTGVIECSNSSGTEKGYEYMSLKEKEEILARSKTAITYVYTEVLPKDDQKMLSLYEQAAKLNIPEASYQIGVCFETGFGVPKNKKKAIVWYTKAAKQGVVDAKDALERCQSTSD